jgi:hypothetical protein
MHFKQKPLQSGVNQQKSVRRQPQPLAEGALMSPEERKREDIRQRRRARYLRNKIKDIERQKKRDKRVRDTGIVPLPGWMTQEMFEFIVNHRKSVPTIRVKEWERAVEEKFGPIPAPTGFHNFLYDLYLVHPELCIKKRSFHAIPKERWEFLRSMLYSRMPRKYAINSYMAKFHDQTKAAVCRMIATLRKDKSLKEHIAGRDAAKRSEFETKVRRLVDGHYMDRDHLIQRLENLGCQRKGLSHIVCKFVEREGLKLAARGSYRGFIGLSFSDIESAISGLQKLGFLKESHADIARRRMIGLETLESIGSSKGLTKERVRQILGGILPTTLWFSKLSEEKRSRYHNFARIFPSYRSKSSTYAEALSKFFRMFPEYLGLPRLKNIAMASARNSPTRLIHQRGRRKV